VEAPRSHAEPVGGVCGEAFPWGDGDNLAAYASRQRGRKPGAVGHALEVYHPRPRPAEPGCQGGEHVLLTTGERDGVEVVRAKRARAHHLEAGDAEPPVLLEGEAADQDVAVHDKQESGGANRSLLEPPGPQERRGQREMLDQRVPGGFERAEVGPHDDVQATPVAHARILLSWHVMPVARVVHRASGRPAEL
jgi:hypothetical protein